MKDANRRKFLLGTLSGFFGGVIGILNRGRQTVAAPAKSSPETPNLFRQVITFANGISLELVTHNDEFLGIGQIKAGNNLLRSGRRPMFVEICNPSAVTLCNYTIAQQNITSILVQLKLSMHYREGGLMEWMLHTVRNRYNTSDWTAEPQKATDTVLWLEIRPVTRSIGDRKYVGLSYQYRYQSQSIPIYKILDRGTWELDGRAVGNEFWMRNSFAPSIAPINSVEEFYSTEWYLPSAKNPNVFQFIPLQTALQGFTFTSGRSDTLVTWATKVSHIRSLFEKPHGVDEIIHWHQHCADLGQELVTSPMEVLWAPGELDRVGQTNAYEAVRELVHETLHTDIGMRRERITTYGLIEQWDNANFKQYTEVALPKLLESGVKMVALANHFQNNMNTFGVGNMACTIDLKVADSVGEENLRNFCHKTKAGGAIVQMWGNTALSTFGLKQWERNGAKNRLDYLPKEGSIMEAIERSQDPFVRNPSNAIEADHYTPVFAVLNLRDPVIREYWLKRWKQAHDEIGLEAIFLDSSTNLSSDKFHFIQLADTSLRNATSNAQQLFTYRPAKNSPSTILSQYHAHLKLMTEMQTIGYRYCGEDIGVFGVHRTGPSLLAKLNYLPLWMDCLTDFDTLTLQKAGVDPNDIFFRGLAYRMMWYVFWDIKTEQISFNYGSVRGDFDKPNTWHISLFKVFNKVNDLMINREILPNEQGVVYRTARQQVLWAFHNFNFKLPGSSVVRDETTGKSWQTHRLQAIKHHVYYVTTIER
ncbi:hypothetical protein WA1_18240 [Scytonema hofmannii PCC 7110]|uniref:Uncharacterized protein n=1 Tax=Scytonema hofmannii PCC 7110 TaxID=128403 RepID=A0A139XB78_9CYAN|nr:hypothetical protein [Scytonema hofmannii]KYC41957.1 hypothetical protein WA1_18240 [Scytonema hofmannii PCC 7110]